MAERIMHILVSVSITFLLSVTGSFVNAEEFSLAFPADCELGRDCIIQNYVDLDPGPGWKDYTCGSLTYDGHKGTDIRVRDLAMLEAGVAVYAAAGGVVAGTRNSMADRRPDESYADYMETVGGKECGNGVRILHQSGHETQYCHMRKGSIAVQTGDRVAAGDLLGYMGMSGNTEFPHLHISVRKDKQVVSPFTGPCSPSTGYLWRDRIAYTGTHLLKSAFSDAVPTLASIETGTSPVLTSISPALLFWVNVVGVRAGDSEKVTITGPGGGKVAENTQILKKSKVNWLSYVGKKRPRTGWPKGTYAASYTLSRNGEILVSETASVTVR